MARLTLPKTPIKIEKPTSDFSEHLLLNNRILFSGKFGIGKTFFLKEYFKIEEVKEKYNVFHLFPINYQIAANEDIFELIKYDILCHLLNFDWVKVKNEQFSNLLVAQSYFLNNGISIASKIMKCIPVVSGVGKAIETLTGFHKDFVKYKNQINENDTTLLTDFFNHFAQKQGSVHEFDAISEFISVNLANCNNGIEEEKHRKNVLIIDDLDRIDPEHIFRLLNIFSAHFDIDGNTNKFGFDKIMFVCDVNNIRNIFAAKYGQYTDFGGYIDKFYSSEVFHFNNKVAISEFIREAMNRSYSKCRNNQINFFESEIEDIRDLLFLFLEGDVINLRQILANVENLKDKNQEIGVIRYNYFSGYTILWTCYRILGGQKDTLINALEKAILPLDPYSNVHLNNIAASILPLLIDDIYNKDFTDVTATSFTKNDIQFNLKSSSSARVRRSIWAQIDPPTSINYNTLQLLLIESVNKLEKKGFLN